MTLSRRQIAFGLTGAALVAGLRTRSAAQAVRWFESSTSPLGMALSEEQQANEEQWMAEKDELAARVAELTARLDRAEAVASASQADDADIAKNVTDEPAAPEEHRPAA